MTSGGGSRDGGAKFGVQEGASLRLDEERGRKCGGRLRAVVDCIWRT